MIGRAFKLRLLVAAIGVLGQSVLVSAQSPSRDEVLTAFSRQLRADVAADDVGGIVAGVMVDGDLVWAQAFGWADRDARTPMSTASISRTGSISKSVTAVLMMRLLDEGVIGLDEPVERYLPAFASVKDRRVDAQPVTFRHLASHTAGLIREP